MQVETFEQQVERHPEACEEAARLIAELGLEGQQSITSPHDDAPRCPYRQWNALEMEVYTLLCPTVDSVESYEADTIPLRVLQVLAHAKSLGIYEKFEIRHAANPAVKDPILLGVPSGPNSWQQEKRHLLARWGSELDEFPAMMRQAAKLKAAKLRDAITGIKAEVETMLARVNASEDGADLLGKTVPTFYANGW